MDYRDHLSCVNSHWDLPAHEHAAYQGHAPLFECQDGLVCATYEFSHDVIEVVNSHACFYSLDLGFTIGTLSVGLLLTQCSIKILCCYVDPSFRIVLPLPAWASLVSP
uniref:Uncharacterized protein n=1 Tax=Aegilops tauschii subsp. strangulata TaxID=200361 RepID=A0A453SP77_AEGTS